MKRPAPMSEALAPMTGRLGPRGLGLLVCLLLAQPLQSCGEAERGEAIVIWHSYRGAEQEALGALVQAFNQQEIRIAKARPGRRPIRVRLMQISFENLPNKITNAVPRGHGPDLFVFAHDRLGDWASKGLVEPLGYWVGPEEAAQFVPKTLRAFEWDGRLYGLPLAYKSVALFYNEDLIGQTPPRTTAELIERGRRFMEARGKGYYGLVYEAADTYFHAPWLFGFGGRFLTPCAAGERPAGTCGGAPLPIHSPEAVRALRFARRLAGPGGIAAPEANGQLVTSLFTSGRAAMAITGPWFLSDLKAAAKKGLLRYRVAPMPTITEAMGRPARPLLTVEGVFMSARSSRKAEAYRVMSALASDEAARLRVTGARQLPASARVDRLLGNPQSSLYSRELAAFRDQLASTRLTPKTPFMRLVWEPYGQALAAAIGRGVDADEALGKAAADIERVLGACLERRR
ncbi:MAG: extracellular solute-binding protein [Polyangia bacterium]|jgi:arabinogalactan oligomer/maltooligosaccharide transport system substrate-binding protein|nr:extracellular solute-binding protein [Polyangia bacterium]